MIGIVWVKATGRAVVVVVVGNVDVMVEFGRVDAVAVAGVSVSVVELICGVVIVVGMDRVVLS